MWGANEMQTPRGYSWHRIGKAYHYMKCKSPDAFYRIFLIAFSEMLFVVFVDDSNLLIYFTERCTRVYAYMSTNS